MPRAFMFRLPHGPAALAGLLVGLLASPATWAADPSLDPALPTVEPAPATSSDASKWGLGVAAGVSQRPYAGADNKTRALPLIYYENRWVRVLGAGAELKLPGLDLGSNSSLSFGLRAKYGLGGYKASDAPILQGMQQRKDGLWLGAGVTWHNEIADVSAEWLGDASGKSKGQQLRLGLQREFRAGAFSLTPRIGAVWLDSKYVDYYYGVRADEALAGRAAYVGSAAVNTEIGLRIGYALAPRQTVFVDVSATQLGKQIKNSPLVGRSSQTSVSAGYLYRF